VDVWHKKDGLNQKWVVSGNPPTIASQLKAGLFLDLKSGKPVIDNNATAWTTTSTGLTFNNNWTDTVTVFDGANSVGLIAPNASLTVQGASTDVFQVRDVFGRILNQTSFQRAGVVNVTDPAPQIQGGELAGLPFITSSVYIGSTASLTALESNTITIELLFATSQTANTNNVLFRWRTYGISIEVRAGLIHAGVVIENSFESSQAATKKFYSDGMWHYLALVINPAGTTLYVDDEIATAPPHPITWGAGGVALGRDGDNPGNYYIGFLADVRYWTKDWDAASIAKLRHSRSDGLVGWVNPALQFAFPLPRLVTNHNANDISQNKRSAPYNMNQ